MDLEQLITSHYGHEDLAARVLGAISASGAHIERLDPDALAPLDEFHIGGREATDALFDQLTVATGAQLLDIGSGLGGPARHVARARRCHVTGIDLTAAYVDLATLLTRGCGLTDRATFRHANALAIPAPDATFDGAYQLHVGMNVADKRAMCAEIHRVLRPGAFYAIYDVMRVGDGPLRYPLPWATTPDGSFVEDTTHYLDALSATGFVVTSERNRAEFAIELFQRSRLDAEGQAPAPLSLQHVMGAEFTDKVVNMITGLRQGTIAPVEIIAIR